MRPFDSIKSDQEGDFMSETYKGTLITAVGPEGGGKSLFVRKMKRRYPQIVTTFQPGGTPPGREFREFLLRHRKAKLSPRTMFYGFMTDCSANVDQVIIPALQAGKIVLVDRYVDEKGAYNWLPFGGSVQDFLEMIRLSKFPDADLTLLFDLDPAIGLARNKKTGKDDAFEREKLEYHQKVRQGFHTIRLAARRRMEVVDASRPVKEVFEQALGFITDLGILPKSRRLKTGS